MVDKSILLNLIRNKGRGKEFMEETQYTATLRSSFPILLSRVSQKIGGHEEVMYA